MKYKTLQRANPQDRAETLYYPAPVFGEQIGEDELTAEISFASSVNQSDVRSVLSNSSAPPDARRQREPRKIRDFPQINLSKG